VVDEQSKVMDEGILNRILSQDNRLQKFSEYPGVSRLDKSFVTSHASEGCSGCAGSGFIGGTFYKIVDGEVIVLPPDPRKDGDMRNKRCAQCKKKFKKCECQVDLSSWNLMMEPCQCVGKNNAKRIKKNAEANRKHREKIKKLSKEDVVEKEV
jgi:hypothetical protein